jgi:two-component system, NtrC family, sensor histidine kinase PilS
MTTSTDSTGQFVVPPAFTAFESAESAWRTLSSFAVYRLIVVIVLAIIFWGFTRFPIIGSSNPLLATIALSCYLFASVGLVVATILRIPSATIQLSMQVLVDIVMLVMLMHASGGNRSGIGMLLLISLAAGALVTHGRMAFFHAAVAALAVLFEQLWNFLYWEAYAADFVPAGMLATGYFVIAGLGYTLAKYARGAEQIAEKRGVDLANLAQINELVIRDMQDGFVVVDEVGTIRQLNQQSADLVGGLQDATGKKLLAVAPQLAHILNEWRQDRSRIFSIVRDVQSKREIQLRLVAIGDGALSPTVIFIEDASRIRSQAQQMKLVALGRLTASIAHEIRNPLSSINHAAELMAEDLGRSEADLRMLTIIGDNAHRLDRLVEEVLYLNRRDRAHPEAINLEQFLTLFLQNFCANEKLSRPLFRLECEGSVVAMFDRAHLDQIMWNLIRNAARYASGSDGSVVINVIAKSNHIEINVTDDGPGVATDSLQHLFEPFFTTDTKGTGLGLYIARELADVNGATLEYVMDNGVLPNGDGNNHRNLGAHFRLLIRTAHEGNNPTLTGTEP